MNRSLLLLAVAAVATTGCFSPALDCLLDPLEVSGNVVDEEGGRLDPGAAIVDLVHSPDGCIVSADIRVVGSGGQDCELRAIADGPANEDGSLNVSQFTLESTGDCGWPSTVNGSSSGGGASWVRLDGALDFDQVDGSNVCATGQLVLHLDATLTGNSSETITGEYTFNEGLASVEDRAATCTTE